jgi:uncharacterized protein (TIGR00369 family)
MLEQLNSNTLYQTLGIRVDAAAGGRARSTLNPRQEVCWPYPGQPHGGILFTLMDTTMGWAVNTALEPGYNCTTIDCSIQYLSPARKGPFQCQASMTRQTGRMAFVRAEISDDQGTILASGQAVFRIIRFKTPLPDKVPE